MTPGMVFRQLLRTLATVIVTACLGPTIKHLELYHHLNRKVMGRIFVQSASPGRRSRGVSPGEALQGRWPRGGAPGEVTYPNQSYVGPTLGNTHTHTRCAGQRGGSTQAAAAGRGRRAAGHHHPHFRTTTPEPWTTLTLGRVNLNGSSESLSLSLLSLW